ncbi:hypothetical protein GQ55_8G254400 [Panicum hallii var. hallii]|uniref:Retrovirus-related Pol polyprotein from transposon TNT 1-94-like beta-barrel domain-containing protein n=1 Tax=Panicum hallii var. hallii TaxID=1504633 RepID=A0A2T7CR45_9POAL|nr:hypothetical protein GQ55_8G254400 [Panicum hallii var. hallii]
MAGGVADERASDKDRRGHSATQSFFSLFFLALRKLSCSPSARHGVAACSFLLPLLLQALPAAPRRSTTGARRLHLRPLPVSQASSPLQALLTRSNYLGRNGDPNQMIIQVSETCGAALEQEGETTVRQDSPGPERRSQQRSHGCISQLNMGSGPLAEPRPILDSGATNHAVGDISLLSSFRVVTPSGIASAYIRIRDGRQLPVAGVGTICRDGFHLPDVLYVPGFCAGVILVSVSKLSERGYIIMFGRGQCHVQDQSSGDVVGKGQLRGEDGLYHLEYLKIPARW